MKTTKIFLMSIVLFFTIQFATAQFESVKAGYGNNHKKYSILQAFSGHSIKVKNGLLVENLISKPGNSEDYLWDDEINEWYHYTNTTYSYDDDGRMLEELATEEASGTNLTRYTHLYDEMVI